MGKWQCMPDLSMLVPLSKELDINVNDLLNGKKNDKQDCQEALEENIVNVVSKANKDNKKFRLKTIGISLSIIFIVIPLLILGTGQFLKAPWISFSSFKIMNKASQFYKALQNYDIDTIDKLITNNDEVQWGTNIIANKPNKKSFLNNLEILKDKRVEFTGFKVKQFYYNNAVVSSPDPQNFWTPLRNDFLAEYELCFKDWKDSACIIITFQVNKTDDKINFHARTENFTPKKNKYNPIISNDIYNELHSVIINVFRGL